MCILTICSTYYYLYTQLTCSIFARKSYTSTMKTIQESTLASAIESFDEMTPEQAQNVIDDLADKQPFVLAYTFAVEDEFEHPDAFELFIEFFAIIWLAFVAEFKTITQVTEDEIIEADKKLQEETLRIAELPEEKMIEAAVEKWGNPSQSVVMNYLYQQLMMLQEEDDMDDETASAMISNLTFLVDVLHDAVNKPSMRIV